MRRSSTPKPSAAAEKPDRPTTAPPSTTTAQSTVPDFTDLENVPIDHDALFSTSTDWLHLGRALNFLQDQYEQCLQDIFTLETLKERALNDQERFVQDLVSDEQMAKEMPRLQTLYRIPDIDLERFGARSTRRGLNKKEQNAEVLLGRVKELQQRGSAVLPIPYRSDMLSVGPLVFSGKATDPTISELRHRYTSIIDQPPKQVCPAIATAAPPRKKKKYGTGEVLDTFNIPWSSDEKLRLNELLLEYPEEAVAARRYAKIAAALGTRTATQVFTRVTKLMASKRQLETSDSDQPAFPISSTPNDSPVKDVAMRVREYNRLKQALEAELSGVSSVPVHVGTECGQCGARPIVGMLFRCVQCQQDLCDGCWDVSNLHNGHNVVIVQVDGMSVQVDEYNYLHG